MKEKYVYIFAGYDPIESFEREEDRDARFLELQKMLIRRPVRYGVTPVKYDLSVFEAELKALEEQSK